MDVVDKGPSYVITVDMPGVKKEAIDVSIEGSHVAINAESVYETPVKEGEKLLHTERFAASYARSFELPSDVTDEGAEAVFENGVLTLTLPKRAPTSSKRLMIH
jgi:HSP20 family protein